MISSIKNIFAYLKSFVLTNKDIRSEITGNSNRSSRSKIHANGDIYIDISIRTDNNVKED